jgi:hypothetical protein
MAVEIIIQVGDRAYWQEHWENKVFMRRIYRMILEELQYQLPQFVVANAVAHMDEDSPHMHVVGVLVGTDYKKGMSKQVSKRKVFTKDVFSIVFQDKLRAFANERADRIEAYIKTQSDTLVDLEEKATKLERRAEIAEMVYDMARGSGGNEDLREKLIDVMYENEQLKAENFKLREILNKAYDFMKQFVMDGRNLLERFLESIGQVVEKVRDDFSR